MLVVCVSFGCDIGGLAKMHAGNADWMKSVENVASVLKLKPVIRVYNISKHMALSCVPAC